MPAVGLFVNGTLMRGLHLHKNLAGAVSLRVARTAPRYRLFSVRDIHPAMMPAAAGDGVAVTGEVYDVALDHLQRVLDGEPPGLGLGVVDLEDGAQCLGILWVSARPPVRAVDISAFGGWREYHVLGGGTLPQAVLVELCGRRRDHQPGHDVRPHRGADHGGSRQPVLTLKQSVANTASCVISGLYSRAHWWNDPGRARSCGHVRSEGFRYDEH